MRSQRNALIACAVVGAKCFDLIPGLVQCAQRHAQRMGRRFLDAQPGVEVELVVPNRNADFIADVLTGHCASARCARQQPVARSGKGSGWNRFRVIRRSAKEGPMRYSADPEPRTRGSTRSQWRPASNRLGGHIRCIRIRVPREATCRTSVIAVALQGEKSTGTSTRRQGSCEVRPSINTGRQQRLAMRSTWRRRPALRFDAARRVASICRAVAERSRRPDLTRPRHDG